MDDYELSRNVFSSLNCFFCDNTKDNWTVDLNENDDDGNIGYSIKIKGVPNNTLVLKTDILEMKKAFMCAKGECKRADFAIIATGEKKIIFIEMKKTKLNNEELVKQLKGASVFVDFCKLIVSEFWGRPDFLRGYKKYYVSLSHTPLAKGPSKSNSKKKSHTSPEKHLRIRGMAAIHYQHL